VAEVGSGVPYPVALVLGGVLFVLIGPPVPGLTTLAGDALRSRRWS
jgi:hypothetical protein